MGRSLKEVVDEGIQTEGEKQKAGPDPCSLLISRRLCQLAERIPFFLRSI